MCKAPKILKNLSTNLGLYPVNVAKTNETINLNINSSYNYCHVTLKGYQWYTSMLENSQFMKQFQELFFYRDQHKNRS